MKMHTLTREQFVPADRDEVFAFFARPENLSRLTPPGLGFVILTPRPVAMEPGALIDYTIRVFGFRLRWTTLISEIDPGRSFVDEQSKGPYSSWRHTHLFGEAPGGTVVRDEVRYALPLGPIGELAHALAVKRRLRSIFDFRERAIAEIFGRPCRT